MARSYSIAVIGLWHLGEIYSAGLAELGHHVVAISSDGAVIENFKKGIPPLPEPELSELIAKNVSAGRLEYTGDMARVETCDVVWLAFDTPVGDDDEADVSPIMEAVDASVAHLQNGVLVAVSSQLPVGISEKIISRIAALRPELKFDYVYTPENLRLGEAVQCFMNPVRVIAGAHYERGAQILEEIFSTLPAPAEIISMAPASAEMGKHALNAFLAAEICFANDISDIAEEVGADMLDVTKMLKSDPRIGAKAFLDAGTSFSGGTLNRDVKVLANLARALGIQPSVIEAIYEKNEARKGMVASRLEKILGGAKGKTIALFGLTYKPGTKTLRRSYPLEVARELIAKGALLHLHDPEAEDPVRSFASNGAGNAEFFRDPYEAASGADAVVFLTSWPQFKDIDFSRLKEKARPGALVFDTANFLCGKEAAIRAAGFLYRGVGRPVSPT